MTTSTDRDGGATILPAYFGEFGGMYVPQILMPALRQLEVSGGRYALVTMCIGVGQGIACVIERLEG